MNPILLTAFNDELEKIAAPMTNAGYYEDKKRMALKSHGLSGAKRMALMRSYQKDRSEDKARTARGAGLGALGGGIAGSAAGAALTDAAKPLGKKYLIGALVGGTAGAALLGGKRELERRAAGRAHKDPVSAYAALRKTRSKRFLKNEAKLRATWSAAKRGEKVQGTPLVRVDRRKN
jgi:hypothetical protein